ncbi:Uncharacterized protein C7orf50 [Choanephora cucurbitarum]|uniref:Uncharacterized protein C7orf50 n=1 Tax=Choanephora cucurbitarum TaxID=101091 RepID=A0A1C7N9N6_9FUNG|nr:Uncharacterized protein C7orf50 [Choanephora cucurbitarum]
MTATPIKTPKAVAEKKGSDKKATKKETPKMTLGQKMLKTMTAQKAAKKALMKGVSNTKISFDEEGNESTVETIVNKLEPEKKKSNSVKKAPAANKKPKQETLKKDDRPAVKKPEPTKKRSVDNDDDENNVKPVKKVKKAKKSKAEVEESKKDAKQEEALAYVRLFVNDRVNWKFKKMLQIWLLSNLYQLPEEDFDNVLVYLKDLQGQAREKTKKEAQDKIPTSSNTLTSYSNVATTNDFDDFDAEKLLAQAAPVQVEEESSEVKRARRIIDVLS